MDRNASNRDHWLKHRDPRLHWEAFKLAQSYAFVQPVGAIVNGPEL